MKEEYHIPGGKVNILINVSLPDGDTFMVRVDKLYVPEGFILKVREEDPEIFDGSDLVYKASSDRYAELSIEGQVMPPVPNVPWLKMAKYGKSGKMWETEK